MPIVLLLLVFSALPLHAESPAPYIAEADAHYAKRSDLTEAEIALASYQRAMSADATTVEAFWKASRVAWWLGDHAESHKEKIGYFQKGIDYAQEAVALAPDSAEAHMWLGANYGSFGETKGILKSLALVKPIRHEMDEVNRINDRFDGGGGYRVLGVVDYQVPGIAGGNKKRALEELNKALAIDPNEPFTRYYLAEYYKTVGDSKKMREEWMTLKTLPVAEENRPEWEMLLKKGEKAFESRRR